MFLSDYKTASQIKQQKFTIEGSPLRSLTKQHGYQKYTIRVLKHIHPENDPQFPCKKHDYKGEYNQCLEEEFTRQSLKILNCTPPWMTDNQDIWCKHNVNLSSANDDKCWFLLGKL